MIPNQSCLTTPSPDNDMAGAAWHCCRQRRLWGGYIGGGACIEIGRIFLQLLAFITINHSLKNPNSLKDLVTFCAGVAQILAKKIPVCHKPRSTFLGPSPSFLCRFSYYLYHIISSFISIKQDDKQHHPIRNWIY